ncbi:hypothetical protein RJ639_019502 [Escallonia herrerae]|uniref:Uncharacterized protein n=1 Tax=Escallonia herrerae TaxID=1293975 RepID=A0AA88VCQ0_9ASTE|nr:hypothetical protein RJ639_019502 [Escallonia herrerae]
MPSGNYLSMQPSPVLSLSPSFNSYSSSKFAQIAARVVEELRVDSESEVDDVFGFKNEEIPIAREYPQARDEENDDDDFEFALVSNEIDTSPIPADQIFYNGQIRPVFPVFDRNLLSACDVRFGEESKPDDKPPARPSSRLPLRKLFFEERETSSCSSSEADELDGLQPDSYCVWRPKLAAESPDRCKKSGSTGSSKRWKFKDFLHRSNSEGKDSFVVLTSASPRKAEDNIEKAVKESSPLALKARGFAGGKKEGDRRRSYLPHRQDLTGFISSVSRNINPF